MDRCNPVDMRKNLEVVDKFKEHGIDFVPVPARNSAHKRELIQLCDSVLEEMTGDVQPL